MGACVSIFDEPRRLKFSLFKSWRINMEAKVQNMIRMKDEMDFFSLIESKLEKQGFEVLETLPPDRNTGNNAKADYIYRPRSRYTY